MVEDRRRRVNELLLSALELEPESRPAFLESQCGEDTDLRRQVEVLLAKQEQAGSFLETPAIGYTALTQTATVSPPAQQFGVYRIVAPLGAGGMGEVFRAHDSRLGRDVAMKFLPAEFARDPDRLARFRREARILASLSHPHIGAIFGLEENGDVECLILELVEGETPRGPLPVPRALEYARQVAEALEAAHAKGIIHRDLKPPNIKVTPQGQVKVLDFGLAKAILGPEQKLAVSPAEAETSLTLAGHIVGTPGYMSPEQVNGSEVDARTDIWAFGCLLYELLTGKRAFAGETLADRMAAVKEREPDWRALPAKTPPRIRELLRRCLEKQPDRRLASIAEARKAIEQERRSQNRWYSAAAIVAAAGLAGAFVLWMRAPVHVSDQSQWVQLTKFPDAVSQPAVSPDGRMLAFIRGDSTFLGAGQVYVKPLPDGEPKQLTHDSLLKMSPVFSPDGTRVAYTIIGPEFNWDTWTVPVLGGEPQQWFRNASGLVWAGPRQLLFSEIVTGVHMKLVSADENRIGQRDVYVPAAEPDMVHRSYLSPDGKWVLLVEMDEDHAWLPCRVVPADGSSRGRQVGPSDGGCTTGGWSPDGKWIYMTSNAVGGNHIWRQRFPDGTPEQITSGPTEEEGTAISPDGKSLVTAVSLANASLWVHNKDGDRQVAVEGNAADPRFTPDGRKLIFRIVKEPPTEFAFYRDLGELRLADLKSGQSEPLFRGITGFDYDLSRDGQRIAMEIADTVGKPRIWTGPLDRSSPPRQIPGVEGTQPRFGPGGEVFFRLRDDSHPQDARNVYRVRQDGTGLRKAFDQSVLILNAVSPDGRWVSAWAPLPGNGPAAVQMFPLDGGPPVAIAAVASAATWASNGTAFSISGAFDPARSYIIPLHAGEVLPRVGEGGFHSDEELARLPGVRPIDAPRLALGPSADVYAYYRGAVQRNLYRIPIP